MTDVKKIAYRLARKRLALLDLATRRAQLLPVASRTFLGRANTPARRALQQKSRAAQAELLTIEADQAALKSQAQALWLDLDDAVSEERDDSGFPFYLPWQADDWDYPLDAYYQGLEALKADLTKAWQKASKEPRHAADANVLANHLMRLFELLEHKAAEKKYIQVLVQQPSIVPAEYLTP